MAAPTTMSTSLGRLRVLILVALVVGLTIFTGVMFSLVQRLSERFGPQVKADLEWRAERGAQELSKTADLGLAMSDKSMVKDSFGVYATSSDVLAIVAVDAADHVVAQHGTFAGIALVLAAKPRTLVEGPGYIASWAPAEIEGNRVGKVAVIVSTARMTDARAVLRGVSRTTLVAGLVGLVLGCLVLWFFTRAVAVRDRQLNDYAENLEHKVEDRTRELDERNHGMRLVLDNVAQGFVTIDANGVMASERSAIVERWFGTIEPGATFGAYVGTFAPAFATWLELGLESLRDGFLPLELSLAQLPRRFVASSLTFDVAYSPIMTTDQISSILLIVSDVTAEIERERTERAQHEVVELFQHITADRAGFDEFYAEAGDLVAALRVADDGVVENRIIHTLKGNCSIFGIHSYAQLCHEVETELGESGEDLSDLQRTRLLDSWTAVTARLSTLLDGRKRAVIEIDKTELDRAIDQARSGSSSRELADTLVSWQQEPVALRFERLGRQATGLAHRLGKSEIAITINDHQIRLDPERWVGFWAAMIHAVRNAVDHGIEEPAERAALCKPPTATITLGAVREPGRLLITLSDDGRGVDWDAVRASAARRGLSIRSQTDLTAALFADGLSTREQASELSGRGVGLGALRAAVEQLGGTVDVQSTRGLGTSLVFAFPDQARYELRPPSQPLRNLG